MTHAFTNVPTNKHASQNSDNQNNNDENSGTQNNNVQNNTTQNNNVQNNTTQNNNAQNNKKHKGHRPLALNAPKQRQGGYFEQQALAFLQQQGLTLIAQNWQQPKIGELDLVMLECRQAWSTLVFIEVRQRVRSNFGDAALSITPAKQRKIIKTAHYFLQQYPEYADNDCRFDVMVYDTKVFSTKTDSAKTDNAKVYDAKYVNDMKTDDTPEWLIGAFIASAW